MNTANDVRFAISAKTARLIGRENIPSLEGALIELVKNSYDADASCSVVLCNVPYSQLPPVEFGEKEINKENSHLMSIVEKYYSLHSGVYTRIADMVPKDASLLSSFFSKKNYIAVIDNGSGMSKETVNSVWMTIGTNDKEQNPKSKKKNRVKTGAKGIGRFAVDRLSTTTKMITHYSDSKAVIWSIDWNQFDGASMLSDIAASELESDSSFESLVSDEFGIDLKSIGEEGTDWTCGTCIFLSPLREIPDARQMDKITRSLRNINPMQNSDRFNVYLYQNGECILKPENTAIDRSMFDYHVIATYDGDRKIVIQLDRNEIDINKKFVQKEVATMDTVDFSLDEFWASEAFSSDMYSRKSFNELITMEYDVANFFSLPTLNSQFHPGIKEFRKMGKVKFEFFFLKNTSSPDVEILKTVQPRVRKKILSDFVGVKIFRDGFRIRPYGEPGSSEDWIGIGIRHGKSPAAASHEKGYWRISSNQIIGSVDIGRESNPYLVDTANREGLAPSPSFDCLIDFLQESLAIFEFDRQYPLREYSKWLKEKEEPYNTAARKILDQVRKKLRSGEKTVETEYEHDEKDDFRKEYSASEYEDAINLVVNQLDSERYRQSLVLSLCTAGMLSNTFVHEASAIESSYSNRWENLELFVGKLIGFKPYDGDPDFDPFEYMRLQKADDNMLASWISLIMDTSKRNNVLDGEGIKKKLDILIKDWEALLICKRIEINFSIADEVEYQIELTDLAIIINNFILNSAWFLERQKGRKRVIKIEVKKDSENKVLFHLENNGPPLDEVFIAQPDVIFEAGVSSKKIIDEKSGNVSSGSGLGLWFMKMVVEKYNGTIVVEKKEDGFGLEIYMS